MTTTWPYQATTVYYLNTPFYKVLDGRYPNSIGNQKNYESREVAEREADRLNRRVAAREAWA